MSSSVVETDRELLTRVRSGDEAALESLLARYAGAVQRFGLRMCRDPEDAKDVLQETLFAAARGLKDFRGDASLGTWFFAVARSFCLKKQRRSKFAPSAELPLDAVRAKELAASQPLPDQLAAEHELESEVASAIDALDTNQREVLLLRDVEGLSGSEVAQALGISLEAVKSRLHRARAELRARLEPRLLPGSERPSAPLPGCPEIVAVFSRYLEGEIGPAQCAEMQAHVASCARCRATCASLERTLELCRAGTNDAVPEATQTLVKQAIRGLRSAHVGKKPAPH